MDTKVTKNSFVVSFYANIFSKMKEADLPIEAIIKKIQGEEYRPLIEEIKSTPDKLEKSKLKQTLSAITTSCITSGPHNANSVLKHSGLIQVDFDDLVDQKPEDVKLSLCQDPYTMACFYSPSGNVKCIFKIITDINLHRYQFLAIEKYIFKKYGLKIDPAVKDINRLMFLSYDPDIYYNPDSLLFQEVLYPGSTKKDKKQKKVQSDALKVIELIENRRIDITGNHNDWIKIIYSLIEIFPFNYSEYIHRISRFYPNYTALETQSKIEDCIKSKGTGITGSTFFYYVKNSGIDVNMNRKVIQDGNIPEDEIFKKGKIQNGNKFLQVKHYLNENYELRFNTVSLDLEVRQKGAEGEFKVLNENNLFIEHQEKGYGLSLNHLLALLRSEFIVKYDPITSYFENLQYDGVDHIEELANYVKAKDQKEFNLQFRKWLIRVVACAMNPNYFNKQAFILVGEAQNTGKSTFLRFLCPPQLKNYIAENIGVDKDSRIQLVKNILINMDELSTMSKNDINSQKSLISQRQINERLPYDRKNSIITRRCSFMGSTNVSEFLSDETGTVRWLCFEIDTIDWAYSKNINIDDVYGQAYALFKDGFEFEMTRNEIEDNHHRNNSFHISTTEEILIEKYFKPSIIKDDKYFFQPSQVFFKIMNITDNKYKISPVGVGKALKFLGYKRIKHSTLQRYGIYIEEKNENDN